MRGRWLPPSRRSSIARAAPATPSCAVAAGISRALNVNVGVWATLFVLGGVVAFGGTFALMYCRHRFSARFRPRFDADLELAAAAAPAPAPAPAADDASVNNDAAEGAGSGGGGGGNGGGVTSASAGGPVIRPQSSTVSREETEDPEIGAGAGAGSIPQAKGIGWSSGVAQLRSATTEVAAVTALHALQAVARDASGGGGGGGSHLPDDAVRMLGSAAQDVRTRNADAWGTTAKAEFATLIQLVKAAQVGATENTAGISTLDAHVIAVRSVDSVLHSRAIEPSPSVGGGVDGEDPVVDHAAATSPPVASPAGAESAASGPTSYPATGARIML